MKRSARLSCRHVNFNSIIAITKMENTSPIICRNYCLRLKSNINISDSDCNCRYTYYFVESIVFLLDQIKQEEL